MSQIEEPSLSGWAVPASFNPSVDHTYVTSSCGLAWGCWGRKTGGSPIAFGAGDASVADCLSQTKERAGIIYGFTGVCHQAANRILFPAHATIDRANGYVASVMAYGTYGIGSWPQRLRCVGLGAMKPPKKGLDQAGWQPKPSDITEDRKELYLSFADSGIGGDFTRLARESLGENVSAEELLALLRVQESLFVRRAILMEKVSGAEKEVVDYDNICDEMQMNIYEHLSESLLILGRERFETLFGANAFEQARIIDRNEFKECSLDQNIR